MEITTLYDIFKAHIGGECTVEYVLFTSYDGLDLRVLRELLLALPKGNMIIRENKFDVFCGAKSAIKGTEEELAELLLKSVHRVIVEGAFHPKLYLVKYRLPDGQGEYLLVAGSKNITKHQFLDSFICLRGIEVKQTQTGNGKQLKEWLATWLAGADESENQNIKQLLEELPLIEFSTVQEEEYKVKEIKFYTPNERLLLGIHEKASVEYPLLVVSPFLTDYLWKTYPVLICTRTQEVVKLKNQPMAGLYEYRSCYYYSDTDNDGTDILQKENIGENIPPLHAKLYVAHKAEETYLYIGSANYTYQAFSDANCELLIELCFEDATAGLYQQWKEEVTNESVWKTVTEIEERQVEEQEKTILPFEIYKRLQGIQICGKEVDGTFRYKIGDTVFRKELDVIYNGKTLKYCVAPATEDIVTRNGMVTILYGEEKYEYVFDVPKIMKEEALRADYENRLRILIEKRLQEQKKYVFEGRKTLHETDRDTDSSDKASAQKRMTVISNGMLELFRRCVQKTACLGGEEARKEARKLFLERCDGIVAQLTMEEQEFYDKIMKAGKKDE